MPLVDKEFNHNTSDVSVCFRAQAKDALDSYDNAIKTGASVQNGPV